MLTQTGRRRIAVLVSGRGSNLQAIMRAGTDGRLEADIALVLSNRAEAPALAHAAAAGLPTRVLAHGDFPDRDVFDAALAELLTAANVDLVCLAGFMRRVGPALLDRYPRPILNIHPSLLPAFPGMNAQQQAVDHGVKITGVTVHFVTAELDAGPIVLQRAVPVLDADTGATLSARLLPVEHDVYPEAIQRVLYRQWRLVGRRVQFDSQEPPLR
jgi:phosphoribosylglycinamide formyltransferase-1